MQKYPYVIIFSALEAELDKSVIDAMKFKFHRKFVPYIDKFEDSTAATKWANENIGSIFDERIKVDGTEQKRWILPLSEVYLDTKISGPEYKAMILGTKSGQELVDELNKTVSAYLEVTFDEKYEMMWRLECRTRGHVTEEAKLQFFVTYIHKTVRNGCEKALGKHSTYFGANYATKINEAITIYYNQELKTKVREQQA